MGTPGRIRCPGGFYRRPRRGCSRLELKKRLAARLGVELEDTRGTASPPRRQEPMTPSSPPRFLTTRVTALAAWALVPLVLSGCSVQSWRSSQAPVASVVAAGAPLRVTTRVWADGRAHRYVLSSASVEGDSLVGVVDESYQLVGASRWSLQQGERGQRLAIGIADVAEVSRQEREASATRTGVLLVGIAAGVAGAFYVFLAMAYSGGY